MTEDRADRTAVGVVLLILGTALLSLAGLAMLANFFVTIFG